MATRRVSLFIAAFLALQIVLPVEYYACREDEYDERFAWRMFSPERMVTCRPSFWLEEDGVAGRQAINLNREFHQAWIETARRGRLEVVRQMALHLCDENPDKKVRVELVCDPLDTGPYDRAVAENVCETGELR